MGNEKSGDLGNSYSIVQEMLVVPFGLGDIAKTRRRAPFSS